MGRAGDSARRCLYSLAHMGDRAIRRVTPSRVDHGDARPRRSSRRCSLGFVAVDSRRSQPADLRRRLRPGLCHRPARPDHRTASPTSPRSTRCRPGSVDPAKVRGGGELGPRRDRSRRPRTGFVALDPCDRRGAGLARLRHVRAGLDEQAADQLRGALVDRPAEPVHHPGRRRGRGSNGGTIVLVGGGDPYLATKRAKGHDRAIRADLTTLAAHTASALKKDDVTLRTAAASTPRCSPGRASSPTWPKSYVTGNIVTPVSALWADQGVQGGVRAARPGGQRGPDLRRAARGTAASRWSVSPAPKQRRPSPIRPWPRCSSATVGQIVEHPDPYQRQPGRRGHAAPRGDRGQPPRDVRRWRPSGDWRRSRRRSIDTSGLKLYDGSGLSRAQPGRADDARRDPARAPRSTLVRPALVSDLPVSGFTGTLVKRFAKLPGAADWSGPRPGR